MGCWGKHLLPVSNLHVDIKQRFFNHALGNGFCVDLVGSGADCLFDCLHFVFPYVGCLFKNFFYHRYFMLLDIILKNNVLFNVSDFFRHRTSFYFGGNVFLGIVLYDTFNVLKLTTRIVKAQLKL